MFHLGSETDNNVVMFTSIKGLSKVRTTKDSYLPTYMVSTTPFTVDGWLMRSKTGIARLLPLLWAQAS